MFKNLLAFVLLFTLITVGCKEVSTFNASTNLSEISYNPKAFAFENPEDFPSLVSPKSNPLTEEGVQLGYKLFHDPILSADSSMSCSSCHLNDLSMTDAKSTSKGIDGQSGRRSAMSLVNIGFYEEGLFWDGRVKTLEEQALIPVEDTIELHNNWSDVVEKFKMHPKYPILFRKAFGIRNINEIDKFLAAKAIAQYERTLISANAKFDLVQRGEATFTADEKAGYELFFDANDDLPDTECGHCHNAPLMTTNEYLNNGITMASTFEDFPDKGRVAITNKLFDTGKFRVPSLRNIELTAPYMHDGRFKTLEAVIEHYNSGGQLSPNVSPLLRPLNLNETHKRQLLAFLKTLTDRNFELYSSKFKK